MSILSRKTKSKAALALALLVAGLVATTAKAQSETAGFLGVWELAGALGAVAVAGAVAAGSAGES